MVPAGSQPVPIFAVFASGRGSNLRRLHAFFRQEQPQAGQLACVVTDKADSLAAAYAREENLPLICLNYKGRARPEVEQELVAALAVHGPSLLVLAGYMRLLGPDLLSAYPGRIVNIHPSLLPRHAGSHGIRDSFASGDAWLGITIHLVDAGMDTGPILLQKSFNRNPDDPLERIEEQIHTLEHETYPLVVKALLGHPGPGMNLRSTQ